jgi:Ca2+-binding EF-hand superfamily protein
VAVLVGYGSVGDVDGDGCVDDGDLLEVLFSFGEVGMNLRGDLDGDGMVGESDLLEVLLHFGEGC